MKQFLVLPNTPVKLSSWNPDDTSALPGVTKENHAISLEYIRVKLRELQTRLFAERKQKVLIIVQAMDTGGKDGTVRNVFYGIDPLGLEVTAFKGPTQEELDRDFLWRVHKRVPGRGMISVFNRSHYEDVIAVRVRNLAPKTVWEKRFAHINAFEKLLADEGTTILKFFLHISPEEQKNRLTSRLKNPEKNWKLAASDFQDRERWTEFIRAYEEALEKTSTPHAPWYVIPANKKWARNVVVATIVRNALEALNPAWPPGPPGLETMEIP